MKTILQRVIPIVGGICLCVARVSADAESANVTVSETAMLYIIDNGIVAVSVAKESGDLVSMRLNGRELLATRLNAEGEPDLVLDPPGANPNGLNPRMTDHQYGFWSHDAMGPRGTAPAIARVTIDPAANGGERAGVSVKGVAVGRKMGTGPGATPEGQFAADVEIRYTVERGVAGVYTCCIFEHQPDYPTTSLGEARFCAKLADFFDWMSLSEETNKAYPKDLREGDKYIYTQNQHANPAFGWSSTTDGIGFWLINPSMEYISGGPTKVEFLGHRDTNRVAAPCVLNYWRSSHYGGALVDVGAGEHWTKVVGPFLLYANSGNSPQAMFDDARSRQKTEAARWPYDWVEGVDYPRATGRTMVNGRLVLDDPLVKPPFAGLWVGLTAPAYVSPRDPAPDGRPSPQVDWQNDAKNYQFWVRGDSSGAFSIPHVRPGRYTLHAFADGVLGEFAKTDIVVENGGALHLGNLVWKPVRKGRQVWEVGTPNRSGSEFAGGSEFRDPEISLKYAQRFPNDVHFTISASDPARDWFFQHVPHNESPEARAEPYFGVRTAGRATPYSIHFELDDAPRGVATLRLAICGTGTRQLGFSVNGTDTAGLDDLRPEGTITRHGSHGIWYEREIAFDASLLREGANTLVLTVPAGPVNNGLIYDYLRLELSP